MYSVGWYVLHCKSGQEEAIIRSCKHHLSEPALDDAFQFSYERMKKYLGEWHVDTYRMFPDYVFLQSSRPELLLKELKQYRDITDVLAQEDMLLPVQPEEEAMTLRRTPSYGPVKGIGPERIIQGGKWPACREGSFNTEIRSS